MERSICIYSIHIIYTYTWQKTGGPGPQNLPQGIECSYQEKAEQFQQIAIITTHFHPRKHNTKAQMISAQSSCHLYTIINIPQKEGKKICKQKKKEKRKRKTTAWKQRSMHIISINASLSVLTQISNSRVLLLNLVRHSEYRRYRGQRWRHELTVDGGAAVVGAVHHRGRPRRPPRKLGAKLTLRPTRTRHGFPFLSLKATAVLWETQWRWQPLYM